MPTEINHSEYLQSLIGRVDTPCYLIDEDAIEENCKVIAGVQERTGAKILLALKAFALPEVFGIISKYLYGVCASGPIEAQLGCEEFGREVHTYAPAYTPSQMGRVIEFSDHIIFNSLSQWEAHKEAVVNSQKDIKVGLRVNPEYSEIEVDLYNPCIAGSRFGIKHDVLKDADLNGISGLHFHAMCEQGADVLERILEHFEGKFGSILSDERIEWVNFGGGHHITRAGYDIELLCRLITNFKERYNVEVYLEPGEAVVLNGGYYLTTVLDVIDNDGLIGVVDGSAETHLPDVLAMPYRPVLIGGSEAGVKGYTYRLGGISCLAGDVIGDYSFDDELRVGQRLCFTDMALYSFVKNTTFNGVELPTIYRYSESRGTLDSVRQYGYADYKDRIASKGDV